MHPPLYIRLPSSPQVLHVRSLSEWAPVCIGPYSQANTLVSHLHLLAGQIALHPPTMTMATGGLVDEVRGHTFCFNIVLQISGPSYVQIV